MFYVYLITNSMNAKVYVGKTGRPTKRWQEHQREASKPKPRMAISHAIKKYGSVNFKFEILEAWPSEEEALWWEGWWIEYLATRSFGYNIESGGLSGRAPSLETRRLISQRKIGWKPSLETRARMSASHLGKRRTLEAIAKTANALRGRKRPAEVVAKVVATRLTNGKAYSPEIRAKMSASQKGLKRDPAVVERIAIANRGKKRSQETRDRISRSKKLKPMAAAALLQASILGKSNRGRKLSPETRAKMALAQTTRRKRERGSL